MYGRWIKSPATERLKVFTLIAALLKLPDRKIEEYLTNPYAIMIVGKVICLYI